MKTYDVLQPFPHAGETRQPGDTVELHPRQAKYHILAGKLELQQAKPPKRSKKPESAPAKKSTKK